MSLLSLDFGDIYGCGSSTLEAKGHALSYGGVVFYIGLDGHRILGYCYFIAMVANRLSTFRGS